MPAQLLRQSLLNTQDESPRNVSHEADDDARSPALASGLAGKLLNTFRIVPSPRHSRAEKVPGNCGRCGPSKVRRLLLFAIALVDPRKLFHHRLRGGAAICKSCYPAKALFVTGRALSTDASFCQYATEKGNSPKRCRHVTYPRRS